MLTDDDDLIRAQDIPERMQLATSSLSQSSTLSLHVQLTEADLGGAAMWVTQRLSLRKHQDFFSPDGQHKNLKGALVMAVTFALRYLFVEEYEVPYIWVHKRDYICHFDASEMRTRFELLSLNELWRIYALGQKYRSLLERRRALSASYERLQVKDDYYEEEIQPQIDSVELVTDGTCPNRIEQPECTLPCFVDIEVGVTQPPVGDEKCRQRKGHLGRIETLCRRALALLDVRFANRDQRNAQPVLGKVAVDARHLKV